MDKKNSLQDLKALLQRIVPAIKGAPPLAHFQIGDGWQEAVGPHIARKAYPEGMRNGILYVRVETSAWMQELAFLKPEILKRLHEAFPALTIKDIRFRLGTMQPAVPHSDTDSVPLTPAEQALIEKQTAGVKDAEIRASLQQLFAAQVKLKDRKNRPTL